MTDTSLIDERVAKAMAAHAAATTNLFSQLNKSVRDITEAQSDMKVQISEIGTKLDKHIQVVTPMIVQYNENIIALNVAARYGKSITAFLVGLGVLVGVVLSVKKWLTGNL